ncbi:hypothetical protein PILCRDRAFT_114655 [Piloderma croceum F 1598]|uniref:Uncharacterized protein n=1 Tax=Piloderma croceum (strain F 1598) TaxID=765440 RepID=A0A0C3GNU7_PILCF|nr:hypothetical protein PILCRDRAFT_114655 [Piloderma croceum F 1598]
MQGEQVDGGQTDKEENTEDLDDRESLDPEVMKKSSIYRFLRKLSRYHVACSLVTSEVVALLRIGAEHNIKVETVPISTTTSTPANENEHASFDSFFERCVRTDLKLLDPMKVNNLRDSWLRDRQSENLFLHAEMQIALFCALNPQLYPIRGFHRREQEVLLVLRFRFKTSTTLWRQRREIQRRCYRPPSSLLGRRDP